MTRNRRYSDQWDSWDLDDHRSQARPDYPSRSDKSPSPPQTGSDKTWFPSAKLACPEQTPHDSDSLTDLWRGHTSRTYQVVLLIQPEKVPSLTTVQWHSSQRCSMRADGYAIMEFTVQNLTAIKSWLRHHAPVVQIIRIVGP